MADSDYQIPCQRLPEIIHHILRHYPNPHSTTLSGDEEALIVVFRKKDWLPLDGCLYALQETIPHLTRPTLHRCLKRHGISRLPDTRERPEKKHFQRYPIGYSHFDIAEVQ